MGHAQGSAPAPLLQLHMDRLRGLSWGGFSFTLPRGWEVTGYAPESRIGRFQFHERALARGELSWRRIDKTPDTPRILSEIIRQYLQQESPASLPGFTGPTFEKRGEWLVAWHGAGAPMLACLWKEDQRTLLQWFFPAYSPESLETVRELLDSYRKNESDPRSWQLFGLGARLPIIFTSERIEAKPAYCMLRFTSSANLQIELRRIGLVNESLAGRSLAELYRRLLTQSKARLLSIADGHFRDQPAMVATFERRGIKNMDVLTGKWWQGTGWIWIDSKEGRIYSCEQCGPPKPPRLDLEHAWF